METLGTYGWRKEASVEEGLFAEGHRFDFYQAVKLLEALAPERLSPGEEVDPRDQAVRFRSRVGLGFAATDVHAIERAAEPGEPPTMAVNFMGLSGTQGPLPRHLAELILARKSKRDTALADFLDIFNNRLVAMLYRARKKYRPALHWRVPAEARISRTFFSLIGLGTPKLGGRMNVDDRSLLHYSGVLSKTARTMVGGERVLSHYFGVPVDFEPFAGAWLDIAEDETTRLGESGQNQILGQTTVVGRRFWDQQMGYEVRVGPVDADTFLDLLPTGTALQPLWALAEFYAGHELELRVRLKLRAAEVPELRLGTGGANAPRLGWTTWLADPAASEAAEAVEAAAVEAVEAVEVVEAVEAVEAVEGAAGAPPAARTAAAARTAPQAETAGAGAPSAKIPREAETEGAGTGKTAREEDAEVVLDRTSLESVFGSRLYCDLQRKPDSSVTEPTAV